MKAGKKPGGAEYARRRKAALLNKKNEARVRRRRETAQLRRVARAIVRAIDAGDDRVKLLGKAECDAAEVFEAWLGPLAAETLERVKTYSPARIFSWRLLSKLCSMQLPVDLLEHASSVAPKVKGGAGAPPAVDSATFFRTAGSPDLFRVHAVLSSVPIYKAGKQSGVLPLCDAGGRWALVWCGERDAKTASVLEEALAAMQRGGFAAYMGEPPPKAACGRCGDHQASLNRAVCDPRLPQIHAALAAQDVPIYRGSAPGVLALLDATGRWVLSWCGKKPEPDTSDLALARAARVLGEVGVDAYVVDPVADEQPPTESTSAEQPTKSVPEWVRDGQPVVGVSSEFRGKYGVLRTTPSGFNVSGAAWQIGSACLADLGRDWLPPNPTPTTPHRVVGMLTRAAEHILGLHGIPVWHTGHGGVVVMWDGEAWAVSWSGEPAAYAEVRRAREVLQSAGFALRAQGAKPQPRSQDVWAVGDRFRMRASGRCGEVTNVEHYAVGVAMDDGSVCVYTQTALSRLASRIAGDGPTPPNVAPTPSAEKAQRMSVAAACVLYELRISGPYGLLWGGELAVRLERAGYNMGSDWASVVAELVGAGVRVSVTPRVDAGVHDVRLTIA